MSIAAILGAGFSRAVTEKMPLTDELGTRVMSRLSGFPGKVPVFNGGYFEAWLSRLAEAQPDLDDAQNIENKSWFMRISKEIYSVMSECQEEAFSEEAPFWLLRMLGAAHAAKVALITFNYDTLVECTVQTYPIWDWQENNRVAAGHIVNHTPPLPPKPGMFGEADIKTFRLLKLHGSLDTYWVSDDSTGATINRFYLPGGWGQPKAIDQEKLRRELPGRTPFIVPPAAAKSSFYGNPVTRELWQSAAEYIGKATEVSLVGYSLPLTDLVVSGMISDRLVEAASTVQVVNLYPADTVDRLAYLGIERNRIKSIDGPDSVSNYAQNLELFAAKEAIETLKLEDQTMPLVFSFMQNVSSAVVGTSVAADRPDEVELILDNQVTHLENITSAGTFTSQPLTLEDIKSKHGRLMPLYVRFPSGEVARIVSSHPWKNHSPAACFGDWRVLIPSAKSKSLVATH